MDAVQIPCRNSRMVNNECHARGRVCPAAPLRLGRYTAAIEQRGPAMYPPVHIADIAQHEGKEVTLHGWLHNRRSSGKLHFLQVRDGTGTIQCVVFKGNVRPEVFAEADPLPQETSLAVTGAV